MGHAPGASRGFGRYVLPRGGALRFISGPFDVRYSRGDPSDRPLPISTSRPLCTRAGRESTEALSLLTVGGLRR
jgi:hypothetical protein